MRLALAIAFASSLGCGEPTAVRAPVARGASPAPRVARELSWVPRSSCLRIIQRLETGARIEDEYRTDGGGRLVAYAHAYTKTATEAPRIVLGTLTWAPSGCLERQEQVDDGPPREEIVTAYACGDHGELLREEEQGGPLGTLTVTFTWDGRFGPPVAPSVPDIPVLREPVAARMPLALGHVAVDSMMTPLVFTGRVGIVMHEGEAAYEGFATYDDLGYMIAARTPFIGDETAWTWDRGHRLLAIESKAKTEHTDFRWGGDQVREIVWHDPGDKGARLRIAYDEAGALASAHQSRLDGSEPIELGYERRCELLLAH